MGRYEIIHMIDPARKMVIRDETTKREREREITITSRPRDLNCEIIRAEGAKRVINYKASYYNCRRAVLSRGGGGGRATRKTYVSRFQK